MDTDYSALVAQFADAAQVDPDVASQYLEASGWNIDDAMASYLSEGQGPGAASEAPTTDTDAGAAQNAQAPQGRTPTAYNAAGEPVYDEEWPRPGQKKGTSKKKASASSSKLRTFRDLREPSEDDEEDTPELYAGGGRSGLNVVDGDNDTRGETAAHMRRLIESIAERNRERGEAEDEAAQDPHASTFTGRGRTLDGGDDGDDDLEEDTAPWPTRPPQEPVTRTLIFWKDGISTPDGPLVRYDDPQNKQILDSIDRGYAPLSLIDVGPDQPVTVNVERRFEENYRPQKKKMQPFGGTGIRLGSDPGVAATSSAPAASTSAAAPSGAPAPTAAAPPVDTSRPVTSLQIRLRDGRRLVARFNHEATVAQLRDYVEANGVPSSSLQLAFPPKPLPDGALTLAEADLLGAALVQR